MYIDTHSHIFLESSEKNIFEIVERAKNVGVSTILMPNINENSLEKMLRIYASFPVETKIMLGLHPCEVSKIYLSDIKKVFSFFDKTAPPIAIGEIGLDLFHSKKNIKEQKEAFMYQCSFAVEKNLPVSIHCRNAFDELFDCFKSMPVIPKGVLHCFTGTKEDAEKVLSYGLFLGIGGVVTYKNAGLDKTVETIPLEKIVLETDAPFLSPHPFRGKPNEPSYLPIIAEKIAQVKSVSVKTVGEITTTNAKNIFFK